VAFPPAFLDELRSRVGLVQVVSRRVKLQKAGREWKGCCPFHNEKTPSFYVNEDKAFYHCFGCGAHGDVIRFVVEQEGLRFPDAVRSLAAEAGIEVPEESAEAREREREKAGLHDVMAEAASWFAGQLAGLSGANARRYVGERGLTPETVERFGLGFAPDGNKLKAALKIHGEDKLTECGLIGHAEDRDESYDRFRGRLMFPIRDPRGRVVGFGGRILGDGQPKYLNSPDTALFDKGRLLYNLDQAGPVARKSARLFVVEGYLDVIALAQAGIAEAVAPLGTALTEQQLQLLWRIVPEPILCFDGDKAGLAAAGRAARRALPLLRPGCSLRILTLPQGQDPDDMIRRHGPEHFLKLAEGAEPLHAFLWRTTLEATDASTPERRAGLRQELREIAGEIADTEIKALYNNAFRENFDEVFGWRPVQRTNNVVSFPAKRAETVAVPKPMQHEMAAILVGWLLYPEVVAADPEQAAALPLWEGLAQHQALRQGILDAVTWNPDIDGSELRHTLEAQGLNEARAKLENELRLDLPFTFAEAEPDRAIQLLKKLADGLIHLFDNWQERRDVSRLLQTALRSGEECDALFERQRDLAQRREAIYRELVDWTLEFGPSTGSRLRVRIEADEKALDAEAAAVGSQRQSPPLAATG
jgi:DNA primase